MKKNNMNKIITNIDKELNIDDDLYIEYSNSNKEIVINIKDNSNVVINIIKENTKDKVIYNIGKNASLIVNKLVIDNSDTIDINLKENSSVTYNYSSINYKDNEYKINVYHNDKNTNSRIVNHGVNVDNNNLDFIVNGTIYKDSINCICNQDNKIISMKDNHANIKPNLIIDNNEIEANHSAYIGTFKEDKMFYLMSRGINKKNCYKLLLKAFLLNNMQIESEKFVNIIDTLGGE